MANVESEEDDVVSLEIRVQRPQKQQTARPRRKELSKAHIRGLASEERRRPESSATWRNQIDSDQAKIITSQLRELERKPSESDEVEVIGEVRGKRKYEEISNRREVRNHHQRWEHRPAPRDRGGYRRDSWRRPQLPREDTSSREFDRAWYNSAIDNAGDGDTYGTNLEEDRAESFVHGGLRVKDEKSKRRNTAALVLMRQQAKRTEQELWELNRLGQAGLIRREEMLVESQQVSLGGGGCDGGDGSGQVAIIFFKSELPPFLKGSALDVSAGALGSGGAANVAIDGMARIVKCVTSDMVQLARNGSRAIRTLHEHADRGNIKERFWELAGTTLGKVLGLRTDEDIERARLLAEGGVEAAEKRFAEDQRKHGKFGSVIDAESNKDIAHRAKVKKQRESLPIFDAKHDLLRLIDDHQICVVIGETGSGKTTQLTQYLDDAGYARRPTAQGGHQIIGCTQPRRVAAVSVAKRVADEMGVNLGEEVGFAIRFEDHTSPLTRIKYMTDGILLRESMLDPELERYSVIVMDEAHERSLDTDVLLGLMKHLMSKRRDIKLIVTSATMNAERFVNFFGGCPVFHIPGRTFPVTIDFARSPPEDYVDAAVQRCLQIHCMYEYSPNEPSDILIFMTGQEDIEGTCLLLAEKSAVLQNKMEPLTILPIYSQLPADLQAKIFEKTPHRKVIIATNIAETSLTVEGVRYVIDPGYCKVKVYSPKVAMDTLQIAPISRANADQRAGRAGRTAAGMCFRLYTERAYLGELLDQQVPEIQRTNLAKVVLQLKAINVEDVLKFDFIDPPPEDAILNASLQLWMLGALDNEGQLTQLGRRMAQLPVDPTLAKMILVAHELRCTSDMLVIVAMLSVPTIYHRPKANTEEADAAREKFCVPESDHLTLLNVYKQWRRNGFSAGWAARHYLQQKALQKVREVQIQLHEILQNQKLIIEEENVAAEIYHRSNGAIVRKAVCAGYFHHVAKVKGLGEYLNLRTALPCHLHPSSALFLSGLLPEYVVYHEVIVTRKEYMQHTTAIEPDWLVELGPMIFDMRRTKSASDHSRGDPDALIFDY